ncbi:malto-oligosyltrehalose trehalohydrolase [Mucilaginibacter ximonensis]|uniref:Malto-oligosyltrehalose trehalohydrolase n=1 Tax=Mucilaginibacter ximonensis TaxID=538021 RepID=A0ABW5Y7D5_9SPHI
MASISKRSVGVNFNKDKLAEVSVWAPMAESVSLVTGTAATLPLNHDDKGWWTLKTDKLQPGSRYGFSIDGEEALPDPASLSQPGGVHELSEVFTIDDFDWADGKWQNHELSNYIIYELHTGTFTNDSNFAAIEQKLDYLLDLGITAIEVMPVAQFPGNRNWGYDGVFPFAVQNSYGGPAGLMRLVDACHQKGLAVILDVVYNHLGPEGNYLSHYGPYITEKYKTPWGGAINFDDAWCDGVRQYFTENALMWFRDFHIDALRLDAVHAIKDFSPKHILQEIQEHVNELTTLTGRQHYLIIECDLNDSRFLKSSAEGGYGINAQWTDEFHHALRVAAGQKREGYYADFNGLEDLAKAYRDAYVYDGQYSEERHRTFGSKTAGLQGQQFVVFSQNHDQVGNRLLGERTSTLVSFSMQKLMAAAVFISPYLPLMFMGEEYGETNPFLYFVSHTDAELVEAVRQGRKEEFKKFITDQEAPDPQALQTFETSKLQWDLINQQPHQNLVNYYKTLIRLRKTNMVLNTCDRHYMETSALSAQQVLLVKRWTEKETLLCLLNFSNQLQTIGLDEYPGNWQKLFDSAAIEWNGPADAPDSQDTTQKINIQPESVIIYTQTHV